MLSITPITLREAHAYVEKTHRHHGPSRGGIFALACSDDGHICGVAVVGRPVARLLQEENYTAEVTRLATDGTKNACSKLYAAAWRAARAIGYRRLITYTHATEPGTSLEAAGWMKTLHVSRAHSWSYSKRPRVDLYPLQEKIRWEMTA